MTVLTRQHKKATKTVGLEICSVQCKKGNIIEILGKETDGLTFSFWRFDSGGNNGFTFPSWEVIASESSSWSVRSLLPFRVNSKYGFGRWPGSRETRGGSKTC